MNPSQSIPLTQAIAYLHMHLQDNLGEDAETIGLQPDNLNLVFATLIRLESLRLINPQRWEQRYEELAQWGDQRDQEMPALHQDFRRIHSIQDNPGEPDP